MTNALVNAAWSRGLGCVINSQGIMQSPVVREHAGIPDDQVIMICVAMGYPDDSFPANAVVSQRKIGRRRRGVRRLRRVGAVGQLSRQIAVLRNRPLLAFPTRGARDLGTNAMKMTTASAVALATLALLAACGPKGGASNGTAAGWGPGRGCARFGP